MTLNCWFQALELKVCTITPSLCDAGDWVHVFVYATPGNRSSNEYSDIIGSFPSYLYHFLYPISVNSQFHGKNNPHLELGHSNEG